VLLPPLYPPKPTRTWAGTGHHQSLLDNDDFIVEPKNDGDRCLVFVLPDGVQLWSRHGRQVTYAWLGDLIAELQRFRLPVGTVLDGELLHEPKPRQNLVLFDLPSLYHRPLLERRKSLIRLLARKHPSLVSCVPWWPKEGAYDRALAEGYEGTVWKNLRAPYEWQRSSTASEVTSWFKMKP